MNDNPYPPLISNMPGIIHGGDYNPEQWPTQIWLEDTELMKKARWNAVTLGVFSWASLEPEEGNFTFDWLDEVIELQAKAGRKVGLATPSAAAPAWLSKRYPETLRVGPDGVRRKHGNRVNYCWTSPIYREKTRIIAQKLAERYRGHPALAYWHVSNELAGECYCDLCQGSFREWLRNRYVTLDALNAAYWAKFWSHTFTDWDQIEAPGEPYGETSINGLTLDWKRFVSDRIVDFFLNEANALRQITPDVPVTTNLMGAYPVLNPFKIAPHLDFAAWDSYPWFHSGPSDIETWVYTAFCHDLNRSLKSGKPFLLMECSPSSSNWYPVMALKRPNAHSLECLQAIAHGADGVQYFQWRQGRGSIEQFHGAVMAHNNRSDVRVFREVAEIGKTLEQLRGVVGAKKAAEVALIYDWEASWAIDVAAAPRKHNKGYMKAALAHYRPLWNAGINTDIIDSESDLAGYQLVIAPMLFMLKNGVPEQLAAFVENGGTLVLTYWSGVVDETSLAFVGGFPEPLRSTLGIWVEEIDALFPEQLNKIRTNASNLFEAGEIFEATELCELIHAEGADVLATYASDFYAGRPALTRNRHGAGDAYYVASRNDEAFTSAFVFGLCSQLGIEPAVKGSWPDGVTVQVREGDSEDYVFVLNCTDRETVVGLQGGESMANTIDGQPGESAFTLGAFESRVLVRQRSLNKAVVENPKLTVSHNT